MKKSLVWNFEIDTQDALDFSSLQGYAKEELRWEIRYFWPEDAKITLRHCPASLLDMNSVELKQRSDVYTLIPHRHLNIKERENHWLYKPLMRSEGNAMGFAKKIDIATVADDAILPGEPPFLKSDLMESIHTEGLVIEVNKAALIFKIPSFPGCKLELTRLRLPSQTIFYSAALEVNNLDLVKYLSNHLLKGHLSCDYVIFLKQIYQCP